MTYLMGPEPGRRSIQDDPAAGPEEAESRSRGKSWAHPHSTATTAVAASPTDELALTGLFFEVAYRVGLTP
jgi:hypothetical protein